eukprot:367599_1
MLMGRGRTGALGGRRSRGGLRAVCVGGAPWVTNVPTGGRWEARHRFPMAALETPPVDHHDNLRLAAHRVVHTPLHNVPGAEGPVSKRVVIRMGLVGAPLVDK